MSMQSMAAVSTTVKSTGDSKESKQAITAIQASEEKVPWVTKEEAEKKLAAVLGEIQRNEVKQVNLTVTRFGRFCEKIKVFSTLSGHKGEVQCLAVFPNGLIASGGRIKFPGLRGTRGIRRIRADAEIIDYTIKLWDTAQLRCVSTLEGHQGSINILAVLADGLLASGSDDSTIKLWDTAQSRCISTLKGHSGAIQSLALLPSGMLASGSCDSTIKLWDTSQSRCISTLEGHSRAVSTLAVLSGGMLASGSDDSTIKLWDISDPSHSRCLSTLEGHNRSVTVLVVLPNGLLASGSDADCDPIKLWDISDPSHSRCLSTLEGHVGPLSALAVLPNGILATGSHYDTIKLLDISDPSHSRCLSTVKGHSSGVNTLAVLPNSILISGSWDSTIELWKPNVVSLSARHLQSVLEALQTNTSVAQLDLSGNSEINDDIIDPLVAIFKPGFLSRRKPNTTLKTIDLRKTGVSLKGIEKLQKAIAAQSLSVTILSGGIEEEKQQIQPKISAEQETKESKAKPTVEQVEAKQNKKQEEEKKLAEEERIQKEKREKEAQEKAQKEAEEKRLQAQEAQTVREEKERQEKRERDAKLEQMRQDRKRQEQLKKETEEKTKKEAQEKERKIAQESVQELVTLQQKIDSWRTEQQEFEQRLQQLVSQQQEAKTSSVQLLEQKIMMSILEQLRIKQESETQSIKLEAELRSIRTMEQKLEEELAQLRKEGVNNPEMQARLTALEEQIAPLREEYQERQEKFQTQQYIYQSPHLKTFYIRLQAKLNQIFLAYMALASGKIKTKNGTIEILGQALNFLTLNLSGAISSGVMWVWNRRERKKMTAISDTFIVSITATDQVVEKIARVLTMRYEEQIKELTLPAEEIMLKRATFTGGPNGGVETLAECAVGRIIDGLRNGQLRADQSWDEALVTCVFLSHYKSGFIPYFTNKDIATLAKKGWTDEGIFQRSGIKVFDTAHNAICYYKASAAKDPCGEPMKYGHQWGTLEEAQELKLVSYQPQAVSSNQPSSGFKSYVQTVTQSQKSVAVQQEVTARVLVQTKDKADQMQTEMGRLKKEMEAKERQHSEKQSELEAKVRKMEEEKRNQDAQTKRQLEAQNQQIAQLTRMMQSMMAKPTTSYSSASSSNSNTNIASSDSSCSSSAHATSGSTISVSLGLATGSEQYQGIFNSHRAKTEARHEFSAPTSIAQKAKAPADAEHQKLTQS